MPAALSDMYGGGPMHRQPSAAILEDTLREIMGEYKHVYIVIDALDECADRNKLLTWIKTISCWKSEVLHMMFSSRREPDIIDHLAAIGSLENMQFSGGSANPDIVEYVNGKLSEKPEWHPKAVTMVKDALIHGADGSFRWVALQLAELLLCCNTRSLKQQLEALPEDLEQSYERILCRASKRDRKDLRRLLQWVMFSARPITMEELADAMTVDFGLE
ncbi:hypothetical protein FIBSPDRAFT_1041208, partial [Athelia psychrophila]